MKATIPGENATIPSKLSPLPHLQLGNQFFSICKKKDVAFSNIDQGSGGGEGGGHVIHSTETVGPERHEQTDECRVNST